MLLVQPKHEALNRNGWTQAMFGFFKRATPRFDAMAPKKMGVGCEFVVPSERECVFKRLKSIALAYS